MNSILYGAKSAFADFTIEMGSCVVADLVVRPIPRPKARVNSILYKAKSAFADFA